MRLIINGQEREMPEIGSLADLIKRLEPEHPYFAVAVNMAFVPKGDYASRLLDDGDRIEILSPMQGG